jgi:signal transduction histidine kinase
MHIPSFRKTLFSLLVSLGIVLIGLLDWLTGPDLSFSIFYLLPIYMAAWSLGGLAGSCASLFAALVWLTAELSGDQSYAVQWIPFWNMSVRLGFFLLTTWLVVILNRNIQRRRFMERLFFHDLLNLTGSLRGFAELLQSGDVADREEVAGLLEAAADRIIDEIETQQALTAAENGDLQVDRDFVQSRIILQVLVAIYAKHACCRDKSLVLDDSTVEVLLSTDQALLTRILGNLIKNALEATVEGGVVSVGCREAGGDAVFWVNNPGQLSNGGQDKLFRKIVSTKGRGRGLGMQSIQLLVAALGGHVDVDSKQETGTTFRVSLPLRVMPPTGDRGTL